MSASIYEVIIFSAAGGLLSLIGGVFILGKKHRYINSATKLAVPFAAGSLLGAVFLDLLKEGLESSTSASVLSFTLLGILGFFCLERATRWFHHHHDEDTHDRESVGLFILANTLHNSLDGIAIGSAFLISVPAGIIATIAVAAHEIPHELGDIGVLLERGLSKAKIIVVNAVGAGSAVLLSIVSFELGGQDKVPVGSLLGLSAGFLIYIAASDLIPTIHRKKPERGKLDVDLIMLFVGVGTVALVISSVHHFVK